MYPRVYDFVGIFKEKDTAETPKDIILGEVQRFVPRLNYKRRERKEEVMINRLLGIIYILISKGTVTATELAERFEVSVRTIYRDIEALSMAGIPVYTKKGKNGGICLMENFVLNKMLISQEEQQEILAALLSVRETGVSEEAKTLKKLGEFFETQPVDWLDIDLSDWSGSRRQLYEEIKRAVLGRKVISFDYYGQNGGMRRRTVEPVQMVFKEYTWYLKAYCRLREDFRFFKLFRMKRLEVSEECFEARTEQVWKDDILQETPGTENAKQSAIQVLDAVKEGGTKVPASECEPCTAITLWIDKKEAYRVYDRFDDSELEVLETGDFLARVNYVVDDWVYGLILSFGPSAKVLEPPHIRQEVQRRIAAMLKKYEESCESENNQ